MKKFVILTMAVATLGLGACQNTFQNAGTKQTVGALGGAVAGGVLGSQVGGGSGRLIATGAGVLLGGLLGSEIGASLDNADKAYAMQAQNRAYAAPVGETISWNNPQSGNAGSITPVRDGYASSGRYCREYQQEIVVGGKRESAYGTACQMPDGSWEIVS
ncbi:MAG: glycine zipper 2TM domain-containing protein [Alphaproteobacteria bacterium]|nr:glycine zipper 2TM domain-containing protein [Alphaproteobacteria bacterium]